MARIVAERLVEALRESNFVIMQGPPSEGAAPLGCGHTGDKAGRVGIAGKERGAIVWR